MLQSGNSTTLQESRPPPSAALLEEIPPPPLLVTSPSRTQTRKHKDQDAPNPMFPTQVAITSADKAFSQGEHQGLYPTMLQRTAGLLRKPQELMKQQSEDSHLLGKIQDLHNRGTGGEYLADDNSLRWYAPPGSILRLAIPRSSVPDSLALIHTTYGHPGVARTTELV